MKAPTGKLALAYKTIANLEQQLADARAQLPSQGGEAVAWLQFVGDQEESSVLSFYPLAKHEVESGWTETPLYTHLADQVAEGVTRKLLERIAKPFEPGVSRVDHVAAVRELRQLLAKSEGVKP